MTQPRIGIYPSRKWPNTASGRRRSQMILLIASMGSQDRARNTPRPRLWDLTAAAFPPALQPVAQPRPPDRCFFLGSKKTRQSFIHKLNIGVCTQANRVKNSSCDETCEEVVVPSGDFAFESEAIFAGDFSDQIGGHVSQRGEIGGGVVDAGRAFVVAEDHVHHPV